MKLEMTTEEMAIARQMLKVEKIPMKHLETADEMYWHDEDTLEIFWKFKLVSWSVCSNRDCRVVPNGHYEKEVKSSVIKNVFKMVEAGNSWKSIDGYMVGCKEEFNR